MFQPTTAVSNWNDVPDEIMEKVGGFIVRRQDLAHPRLVCKYWARYLPLGAIRLTDASVRGTGPSGWGSRLLCNIKSLAWEDPSSDAFGDAPPAHLKSLKFRSSDNYPLLNDAVFSYIIPNLESLDTSFNNLPVGVIHKFSVIYPRLETMDISWCKIYSLANVSKISSLTSLKASGNNLNDAGVQRLCRLPSLTILDISENNNFTMEFNVSNLPEGLTFLDLSSNPITDAGVRALDRMLRLRTLNLMFTYVTKDCVTSFPTSLTSLDLCGTEVDDDSLVAMGRLTLLETLNVSETAMCFEHEVNLPRLKTLKARNCSIVKGNSFAGMPSLKSLDLRVPVHFDYAALYVVSMKKGLEFLDIDGWD